MAITLDQIRQNPEIEVDWVKLSKDKLPLDFIHQFSHKLDWATLIRYNNLPESLIREYPDKVYYTLVSEHVELSEEFMEEFADKLDFAQLSRVQRLSINFIKKYQDRLKWDWLVQNSKVNKFSLILEFRDKVIETISKMCEYRCPICQRTHYGLELGLLWSHTIEKKLSCCNMEDAKRLYKLYLTRGIRICEY